MNFLINKILRESIYELLNEGRNADKAKANTYEVIKNFFAKQNGGSVPSWLDDVFEDQAANPNRLSVLEYIEDTFKRDFFGTNVSDSVIRLEPIMMNVALGLGFEQNNSDSERLSRLKAIITYIKTNSKKEGFPIQLNKLNLENTTYDMLDDVFGKAIDLQLAQDDAEGNMLDNDAQMNPNYEVLVIDDMNEAYKYGKHSCHDSILCFTTHEDMWEKFTAKGANKAYLVLNKRWKEIKEEWGENNPYDEYGLSMIFVFVNPEGNIAFSNTRWNHGTREHVSNVDNSFTKADLSKLLHVNFNSVFKPFSEAELRQKGIVTVKMAKQMLEQGADPKDVFDSVEEFSDGFIAVRLGYKCSLIDKTRKLIGDGKLWFDGIGDFYDGFAKVELNGKCSYINTDGNLIGNGNMWFDWAEDFESGLAQVELNGKYSFINTDGNLIGDGKLWFDWVSVSFYNGFARVGLNGKYSFIDTNGKLIGDGKLWFGNVNDFKNGLAKVKLNGKYSFVNTDGNLIGDGKLWFDDVNNVANGFIRVKLDDKYSFIDTNGKLIGDGNMWFDGVDYFFSKGFAVVKLNDRYSFIDTNGKLIGNGNMWFDRADTFFYNGFAPVKLNGKYYLMDTNLNFYDDDTKQPTPNPFKNTNESKYNLKKIIREEIFEHIGY